MPIYYFDLKKGDEIVEDEPHLSDIEEAKIEDVESARADSQCSDARNRRYGSCFPHTQCGWRGGRDCSFWRDYQTTVSQASTSRN